MNPGQTTENPPGRGPCLSDAEMEELVAGRLPSDSEAAFKTHVDQCAACRMRWNDLRRDDELFKDLRAERRAPPDEPLTHTYASPAAPKAPANFPPDALASIEGYTITQEIGRGGMGVVYEAVQQRLNRKVALKILPGASGLRDPDAVSRFRREATAAARLHHTHIVPVYDFGQSGHAHYYAMELVEGRSLSEMIRVLAAANAPIASQERLDQILRDATDVEMPGSSATFSKLDSFSGSRSGSGSSSARGRVYYRHVARWMADAADALHYAHEQGIIHRDIKPSNLFLARDGRIMILDFGLAKTHGDHSVTMTGAIVGTLRYMSPEQAMAKRMKVDHRTDIYSLGATMYELLTFQPAFAGHDDKETLGLIITRDATPPRKFVSTVPADLETICLKSLEKDPGARYATAKDLAEDLHRYLQDLPIVARPPGPVGRALRFMRRRRAATIAVIATLLLAISVVATIWTSRGLEAARAQRVKDLLESARSLINAQDYDGAEVKLKSALELDPARFGALHNLALVRRHQYDRTKDESRLDEGIDYLSRALQIDQSRHEGWNLKGVFLRMRRRYPEAIEAHQEGIKRKPDWYANWVSVATVHAQLGDFAEAEKCLMTAVSLAPPSDGAMPWHNLAAVQLHLRRSEAKQSCEKALEYDKRNAAAELLWSKLLLTLPEARDPREALDAAISADRHAAGKNGPAKRIRALAELNKGEFANAIASAEAAIALEDRPFSYFIQSIAEAKLNRPAVARDHYLQAKTLSPSATQVKDAQGLIWIDSFADLEALRQEAAAVLDIPTSQPQE